MSSPISPGLKSIGEGAAIIFAQTILPGLLHELDDAEKAVEAAKREAREAEAAPPAFTTDAAQLRLEANTGYRNGVRHALARAAGILGFTGPNWLAELRAYTER
jgi:hypothetical protein